jgi:hypothetical protein
MEMGGGEKVDKTGRPLSACSRACWAARLGTKGGAFRGGHIP